MYCSPLVAPMKVRLLNPEEIIEQGAKFFSVDLNELISKNRERKLVEARHVLVDLLYNDPSMRLSLKDVARYVGKKDHATMINAIRQVSNLCQTDFYFRERYKKFHLLIYGNLDNFRR